MTRCTIKEMAKYVIMPDSSSPCAKNASVFMGGVKAFFWLCMSVGMGMGISQLQ